MQESERNGTHPNAGDTDQPGQPAIDAGHRYDQGPDRKTYRENACIEAHDAAPVAGLGAAQDPCLAYREQGAGRHAEDEADAKPGPDARKKLETGEHRHGHDDAGMDDALGAETRYDARQEWTAEHNAQRRH